ncbi:transporter [Urechidicola vernalis]|uniref:Transporter n=1 Tax=Urechidicola vernalis TaxID=3075600 RepID=A0ABU2Y7Z8_9FLAO|nr:transporter [Urechidicola sp. P050]MDT0554315.1 transporter [Urechidicola sp. P050]
MKNFFFVIFFVLSVQQISAQYTDIINSKRPGNSESPYGVGTDVFQAETGFFYGQGDSDRTFARINPMGTNLFLRYGKFMEQLEFNLNFTYQQNDLQFNNVLSSTSQISGISQFTVGAKYMIYQKEFADKSKEIRSWKKRTEFDKSRWIPSVGVYLGLNTNLSSEDYKESGISPKAAILLQNDFTPRLNLITNLIADKITTDYSVYSYILTMTYAMNDLWSIFVENQGDFTEYRNDFQLGTGAAYLYSRNLQFDAAVRANLNPDEAGFIASIGASWRLDMHQDELVESNQGGKPKKNGGLFGLFKKKK